MMDASTIRIAMRTLARHRGFTTVAVLSLGIAIALNTTMYSAMEALLVPRIPIRDPEHLYSLEYFGVRRNDIHPQVLETALREGAQGFEGVTGANSYVFEGRSLAEAEGRFARIQSLTVRTNFFEVLGTPALAGRTFVERDEGTTNVVISDRLARNLFDDESPVGRNVLLGGNGFVIIGVVERSPFFGLLNGDVWLTRQARMRSVPLNLMRFDRVMDRNAIRRHVQLAADRLAMAMGEPVGSTGFRGGFPLSRPFRMSGFHLALMAAVAAVLLVACANLANLQLARGLARSRELALRAAVGATRRQLIRHLLQETALLAFAGLILGVLLTFWGMQLIRSSLPQVMEGVLVAPRASWGMFAFASAAALVCLFLVGLLPALRVSRVDPNTMLKSGAGTGANREHRRRYGVMVVAQIGFALPVLIGAILLIKAGLRLHSHDYLVRERYGYDPLPIVVGNVPYVPPSKATAASLADVASRVMAVVKSVPGVVEVAVKTYQAVEGPRPRTLMVDGANGVVREEPAQTWSYSIVTPNYFKVYGLTAAQGRDFAETEFDGEAVIVDGPTARYLWGTENPIGRAIKFGNARSELPWHRVVGVAGDLRDTFAIRRVEPYANYSMDEVFRVIKPTDTLAVSGQMMANYMRMGLPAPALSVGFHARVRGNTELAALRIQRALRGLTDGREPAAIPQLEALGVARRRAMSDFAASLFSTFAFIGIALVAIGVYGIVAHSIEERRRELAVRISLGATSRNILHSILREGNVLILAGVAIGLLLTKYGVWWLTDFIPETYGYDAIFFALIATVLFALAAFAAFVPAFRATQIDPVEALRHE